jgi:hypothetical protein
LQPDVRHSCLRARDEDKNLEGAGNLERGKPLSLLFETLKHREKYP